MKFWKIIAETFSSKKWFRAFFNVSKIFLIFDPKETIVFNMLCKTSQNPDSYIFDSPCIFIKFDINKCCPPSLNRWYKEYYEII